MTQRVGHISLKEILITDELSRRSPRTPNLQAENDAFRLLARQLAEHPQAILKTLVNLAKDLCKAGTAGVSLLERTSQGEEYFRWVAIAGALEAYEQQTIPRHSSPCGLCLEHQSPQLYSYPDRYFSSNPPTEPLAVEVLILPLIAAQKPIGAIWLVSHDPQRQFDAEDMRIMTGLADFTAAALHNKRIEESMRQRESDLSLVTNTVPALISFIDAEKRYRFNNQTYEEWFGLNGSEVYGKTMGEVLGEAAYEVVRPYVEQVLAGQEVTFETEITYQNKQPRYIRATYVPRIDVQGRVSGFVALVSDISDRTRTEIALRKSEEQLRIAQQAAKAGMWNWDIPTNEVTWSAEYYHLYGLDPETVKPSYDNWLASIAEQDRSLVDRLTREALEHQMDLNVEFRVLHPTQGERWITAIGQTFCDSHQQPIRMTGIALDVTDRKRANERLNLLYQMTSDLLATEHPMELMSALFSKLSVQLELHYYYNFMVVEKENRTLLNLKNYAGISEETARSLEWIEIGQALCGLVAQNQAPLILNQTEIRTHPQAQFVCSIGATAYAGYPLMSHGRLLGTLSFASLTRSHFTEEELDLLQSTCEQIAIAIERANLTASIQQQAEQLQQANRIKDEFLAVLSHELRSPLNPILGWTKLLQSRKLNEAKTKEALATIERNAKLQTELIEDLLDVSRILQGKLSLNMMPVDLVSAIRSAMETVQLAAEAKSIQIRTNLDASIGKVLGDSARIQQMIWNLLSNAIKFTPPGGRVDIHLERIDRALQEDRGAVDSLRSPASSYAQVTIKDTGKGIASEFLPYVFDYFRQADSATTRKFGGLGLGLAIVRHLVELHGGSIQADSPGEGMGASFSVRLPLVEPWQRPSEEQNSETRTSPTTTLYPLNGLHLLIVDDDTDTREFLAFVLEQSGATVTAVSSAHQVLQLLPQLKPDLLLSDIGMPEMDGYMLLRQVRTLPAEQGGITPAIALTAYAGEINQQQAIAAGFQEHLSKPIEPEKLIQAITRLVTEEND